jgi:exopolysaccharide biosynthesis polyprenyl glycosylphosphotransferase
MESEVPEDARYLGKVTGVVDFISNNKVDDLYCSLDPNQSKDEVDAIIKLCEERFINFYYVPNMDGYIHRKMHFSQYGNVTLINLHNEPLADPYKRAFKRLFDICFSGLFLITLFPIIWIFVAIGTKVSSPGPIFFRQKRTGYSGKSFTMLKFRSMRVNVEADTLQATSDDPRKTKFGDFLRRTSIDELPQMINVFRGDMSVVGPRPHMEYHTETYSKLIDEYLVRHLCKPGLTGWAQVNGCRGETKTVEEMADRVRHDIWYIENWSMLLDLRIIVKTVLQLFSGDKQAY